MIFFVYFKKDQHRHKANLLKFLTEVVFILHDEILFQLEEKTQNIFDKTINHFSLFFATLLYRNIVLRFACRDRWGAVQKKIPASRRDFFVLWELLDSNQ